MHIIGPLATEILAEPVTALQLEATVDDMMFMVHAHPTVWEALGDAFASVRGVWRFTYLDDGTLSRTL